MVGVAGLGGWLVVAGGFAGVGAVAGCGVARAAGVGGQLGWVAGRVVLLGQAAGTVAVRAGCLLRAVMALRMLWLAAQRASSASARLPR